MRTTLERSLRKKSSETTKKGLERAGEILEAARAIFTTEGHAKLSMRGVATRAGVTLGTVQHYYPTKEALLEAMLLRALEDMQAAADRVAAEHGGGSPVEQFRAAMRYFVGEVRRPVTLATFAELKAMALHDPFAAEVMEKIFLTARKSVGRRVRQLSPRVSAKSLNVRSALVLAQLMGLTFYEPGPARRRRDDLAGLDEPSIELMLRVARG